MFDDDWLIGNSYQLSSKSIGCHSWVLIVINECWLSSTSVDCHQWLLTIIEDYWWLLTTIDNYWLLMTTAIVDLWIYFYYGHRQADRQTDNGGC